MSINNNEKLSQLYLEQISFDNVPYSAQYFFSNYSKGFIHTSKLSESVKFHGYYLIHNINPKYNIYIAHLTCLYDTNTEELLYLFEMDENGNKIGHGQIRNIKSDNIYFVDKPRVGFTSTTELYYRQGFAKRRLEYMQELSKLFFHNNLYSDTIITEFAKNIRENFTQEGLAEKIKEGKHDRYRFIK